MRGVAILGLLLATAALCVQTATSNAAGAPANAATDGCSCHGSASNQATLSLQVPTEFELGQTYDVKVTVTGPAGVPPPVGANQGGFALQVSAGALSGSGSVRAENTFATHTGSGNDQRSWDLKWTAPVTAEDVTFHASANAANGDMQANNLDHWNKVTQVSKPKTGAASNATTSSSTTTSAAPSSTPAEGDSSFVTLAAAVLVLAGVALWRRV